MKLKNLVSLIDLNINFLGFKGGLLLFILYFIFLLILCVFSIKIISFQHAGKLISTYLLLGFLFYESKNQRVRNSLVEIFKFINPDQNSDKLENQIRKAIKFLREFEIIQHGQRMLVYYRLVV